MADTKGQAAVHPAMLLDDHEPPEHGEREVRPGGGRLHAGSHLRPHQGEHPEPALDRSVHPQFLREAPDGRGAVLVDAVRFGDRVHQDHGLRRVRRRRGVVAQVSRLV